MHRLRTYGAPLIEQGQGHILQCVAGRYQIEGLKDKTDIAGPELRQPILTATYVLLLQIGLGPLPARCRRLVVYGGEYLARFYPSTQSGLDPDRLTIHQGGELNLAIVDHLAGHPDHQLVIALLHHQGLNRPRLFSQPEIESE
jgi:hypothetical protein